MKTSNVIPIAMLMLILSACRGDSSFSPSENEIREYIQDKLKTEEIAIAKVRIINQESLDEYNREIKTVYEVKATLKDDYFKFTKKFFDTNLVKTSSEKGESAILYGNTRSYKDKTGEWMHKLRIENIEELVHSDEYPEKNLKGQYAIEGSKKGNQLEEKFKNYMEENKEHHNKVMQVWRSSKKLEGACQYCKYPKFTIKTFDDDNKNGVITWYQTDGSKVVDVQLKSPMFKPKSMELGFKETKTRHQYRLGSGTWWDLKYNKEKGRFSGRRGNKNIVYIKIDENLLAD